MHLQCTVVTSFGGQGQGQVHPLACHPLDACVLVVFGPPVPLLLPPVGCSGNHVVIVAQRTMLSKTFARSAKNSGPRPRSRTLKAVQEAILEVCAASPWNPRVLPCLFLRRLLRLLPVHMLMHVCKHLHTLLQRVVPWIAHVVCCWSFVFGVWDVEE